MTNKNILLKHLATSFFGSFFIAGWSLVIPFVINYITRLDNFQFGLIWVISAIISTYFALIWHYKLWKKL